MAAPGEESLGAWFAGQPFVTKWLLIASAVTPVACALRLLPPAWLYWNGALILGRLQVWRALTTFFVAPLNVNLIFKLYMRYLYSSHLETGVFGGRSPDYLYFLLLSSLAISVRPGAPCRPPEEAAHPLARRSSTVPSAWRTSGRR